MANDFPVELSVVLLSYNRLELTRKCVSNILGECAHVDFELIIVDNNSSDGTGEYLNTLEHPKVRVLQLDSNRFFGGGNNEGIKQCRGKYILLTQNDMTFAPHSFAVLLDMKKCLPRAGCIGIGGGFINREGRIFEVSDWWLNPIRRFEYMPVDFNSGCCLLMEREFMESNDIRFDERYRLYWEDVDICHQVSRAGRKIYMINNQIVGTRHLRSATITPLLGVEERERIRTESEAYYQEKWRTFYADPTNRVSAIHYGFLFRTMQIVPNAVHDAMILPEEIAEHRNDAVEIASYEFEEIQSNYEAAMAGYTEAVRRYPSNFLAYRNLCRALSHSNSSERQDEVLPLVRTFLHTRPPVVLRAQLFQIIEPALARVAAKLTEEGRFQDALEHYQELYEIAPDSRTIAISELQIAKVKYRLGFPEEAERRIKEWLIKNECRDLPATFYSSAYFYLGEIHLEKRDLSAAAHYFASALRVEPNHVRAAQRLAETEDAQRKCL